MQYLLLLLLLESLVFHINSYNYGGSKKNTVHKMQKRVQMATKEELLGEDTNRLDQAEYTLQSMTSPETHEADRFFNKRPSKQIGPLRVDTLSPAQVSFIQTSTQWHKYFKPSSPSRIPSNIFPDDPVLYPGMKSLKENEGEAEGFPETRPGGLGNQFFPKRHRPSYDTWNSYGSESESEEGTFQRQKDYGDTPFMDKSWMNPKSTAGERTPEEGYQSFDGKTLAVPEPKQGELPEHLHRFDSQSEDEENFRGGDIGLGNLRHNKLPEDGKANLLEKLDEFKANSVMPQEDEDKELFAGENQKSFSLRPSLLGPTGSLGTALAEELLQKGKGKFKPIEDSTDIVQGRPEANELHELRLLARPMLDERASERNVMYKHLDDTNGDTSHVVLVRSHQLKDGPKDMPSGEHPANTTHNEKQNFLKNKLKKKLNVLYRSGNKRKNFKFTYNCQKQRPRKQNYVKKKSSH
ncbi:uncharacterized protein [Montipora foliosa]|uniref:uncharacterized protein n=1 Tax=Montipora foliosa TaxID=591990 RepID=UPI0035F121DB